MNLSVKRELLVAKRKNTVENLLSVYEIQLIGHDTP